MPLSKTSDIAERISQGLDITRLDKHYTEACYAYGEPWAGRQSASAYDGGEWPDYPDITPSLQEVGTSRFIANNGFIAMQRLMSAYPKPTFPHISDEKVSQVLEQFWLERFYGDGYGDGEWNAEFEKMAYDGEGLGLGVVQIGLVKNPASGMQRVTVRHVLPWQFIWDRHERDPNKAKWVCIQHYLDPEDAVEEFGDRAEACIVTLTDTSGYQGSWKVVKLYEYVDRGIGGKEPTRALFLGNPKSDPVRVEKNVFGCVPVSCFVLHLQPGHRYPNGRIFAQKAIQEEINNIERRERVGLKQLPYDLIDTQQVEPEDLKRMLAGHPNTKIRLTTPGSQPAVVRVGAPAVDQTLLEAKATLVREITTASGVTDADRGNINASNRTAAEQKFIHNQSGVQAMWSYKELVAFYKRTVEKVLKIAALFDRDPVHLTITIQGKQGTVLINDPGQPASYISQFTGYPSRVEMDEDAMDADQSDSKRERELAHLNQLMPWVQLAMQAGMPINPMEIFKEYLRAMGYRDIDRFLAPQQAPQQGAPGAVPPQLLAALGKGAQTPVQAQ